MALISGPRRKGQISDINVTPLVDVAMVLLVVFMITAPLMLNGIKLNLPKTREVNKVNLTTSQVVLSYTRSDEFFIGKDKVLQEELIPHIRSKFKSSKSDVLYLRADGDLKYTKVMRLMSHLKRNGIGQIALITEIEKEP